MILSSYSDENFTLMDCNIIFLNQVWDKRKDEDLSWLFIVFIVLNKIFNISFFSFNYSMNDGDIFSYS